MHNQSHDDDGFGKQSAAGAGRLPDPRIDHRFLMSRSPRRSLSPPRRRDSRRRSSSLERRDFGWDLSGGRGGRISSRSPPPPLEQLRRRPGHGGSSRYEYVDANCGGDNAGLRKEAFEFMRGRVVREDLDGIVRQKPPVMGGLDDGSGRGSYRLATDVVGPTSKNSEPGGGNISLMSSKVGLDRFKDERAQYLDPLRAEKFSLIEQYDKGERPILYTRDAPYKTVAASQSMDFMMTSQLKDFPSTSSGNVRVDFPNPYRDGGGPLPADDYLGGSEKVTLRMGVGRYEERHALGSGRSSEAERKELLAYDRREPFSPARDDRHKYMHNRSVLGERDDLGIGRDPIAESKNHILYKRDTLSPPRADRRNYLYPRTGVREADDYPSDGINRRMSERLDYDLRPNMDPMTERYNTIERTRSNLANSSLWDHHSPEREPFSNHMGMRRSPLASKETGRYLDSVSSHVELRRRAPREEEMPYLGVSKDRDIMLPMKSNYGLTRDACLVYPKDRMRRSPEFLHGLEMRRSPEFHHESEMQRSPEFRREIDVHRLSVRTEDIQGNEYDTYNPSSRAVKRKHSTEEDIDWHDSRDIMSSKWNSSSRTQDLDERDEDWFRQERRTLYSFKRAAYDRENNRRDDRIFDRIERHRFSTYEDRSLSREPADHVLWQSRPHNSGDRYLKGNSKPGSQGWYSSYHYNRKNALPKPNHVWIRSKDGNQRDVHTNEVEQPHNRTNSTKSEMTEDSEEFTQLVHSYFLSFTRKLNDHPAVQKRYKEQGKAGSLFCIVCGRSESKEFIDTQRLATHAFMSHKPGLRAQHLGLHKAICVLLGWNSVAAPDVVTWFPQTITNAEALAQKEDLIIWPPVFIIHNTSGSEDDSERQRGKTVEAIEDFLRGKGVSGGKVKVGNAANNGIMVVKFLGTFSGLQDAEKLQKYFSEKKRGRIDFEKIAYGKGKSIKKRDGKKGGELDELAQYGYMGISEDLDLVDYDTKRKCSIKSKKEIQDIADAPVKPE